MKLFVIAISVSMSLLFFVPVSHGADIAQNICEYTAVDEKGRLRKVLKANRMKLRKVFKDISCNGDNLLIFAAKKNAIEIGELLIKKLPKPIVEAEITNLTALSPAMADLAKERIK